MFETTSKFYSLSKRITSLLLVAVSLLLPFNTIEFKSRRAITEEYAVDLIIVFLLAAILFPIAQNQLVTATTTNWNSAVIVMFEVLLPILVVVTLVRHFA